MDYFVLIYDRKQRKILELRQFPTTERTTADTFRLAAQQRMYAEHLAWDIVLFQARSPEDLRKTHSAYFYSTAELIERAKAEAL
jgi:hypothetical protein